MPLPSQMWFPFEHSRKGVRREAPVVSAVPIHAPRRNLEREHGLALDARAVREQRAKVPEIAYVRKVAKHCYSPNASHGSTWDELRDLGRAGRNLKYVLPYGLVRDEDATRAPCHNPRKD